MAPPAFAARNQFGCYEGHPDSYDYVELYLQGWRDFCLGLLPRGQAVPRLSADPDCLFDCAIYEDVSDHVVRVGDRKFAVQMALVSGTISGKLRVPEMLVRIPLATGGSAVMHAEYGDVDDAAVLLGIAATVSAR